MASTKTAPNLNEFAISIQLISSAILGILIYELKSTLQSFGKKPLQMGNALKESVKYF